MCSSLIILCYVILIYFVSFIPDLLKDFENSKKRILPFIPLVHENVIEKMRKKKDVASPTRVTRHSTGERERNRHINK